MLDALYPLLALLELDGEIVTLTLTLTPTLTLTLTLTCP